MLPHWPNLQRTGLGATDIGDINEFNTLVQTDPQFAAAWGDVQAQLVAEGQTDLTVAKKQFDAAFSQMSQSLGVDPDKVYGAAAKYVKLGQSILGAATSVQGLIQVAGGSVDPIEVTRVFTGTMIGLATALGAVSAGVGAAIVAGVGALASILESSGLFGRPPAAGMICGCPLNVKPDFTVGCLGAWAPRIMPGATTWRPFPNSADPQDAVWYEGGSRHVGPGRWRDGFFGVRGPDQDQGYGNGCANPAGPDIRPIDNAFPSLSNLEPWDPLVVSDWLDQGVSPPLISQFMLALIAGWKANVAYTLNGLQAQEEWQPMAQLIRIWNRSHGSSPTLLIKGSSPSPDWGTHYGNTYIASLATGIINGNVPFVDVSGNAIVVHMGPPIPVVDVSAAAASAKASGNMVNIVVDEPVVGEPSGMSTGGKIVLGGAAIAGAALLGAGVYAGVKGKSLNDVWGDVKRTVRR